MRVEFEIGDLVRVTEAYPMYPHEPLVGTTGYVEEVRPTGCRVKFSDRDEAYFMDWSQIAKVVQDIPVPPMGSRVIITNICPGERTDRLNKTGVIIKVYTQHVCLVELDDGYRVSMWGWQLKKIGDVAPPSASTGLPYAYVVTSLDGTATEEECFSDLEAAKEHAADLAMANVGETVAVLQVVAAFRGDVRVTQVG